MNTTVKSIKPIRLSKPLHQLSIVERRKAVARDVLVRFKRGQLIPTEGIYVDVVDFDFYSENRDLQTILAQPQSRCSACAIGSAICSIAGFQDEIEVNGVGEVSYNGYTDSPENEKKTFKQMNRMLGRNFLLHIEQAFEGFEVDGNKAEAFNELIADVTERFLTIWRQVAKFGDFKYERVRGFKTAHKEYQLSVFSDW